MRSSLIVLLLLTLGRLTGQGQELFKEKIQEETDEIAISWKDTANIFIAKFDSSKTFVALQNLSFFLKRDDVIKDTAFIKLATNLLKLVDSAMKGNSLTQFDFPLFGKEGVVIRGEAGKGSSCDEVKKVVSIVMSRNIEAEFLVAFNDKKDNPVAGFTVKQLNEAFFYDQVRQSLLNLCDKVTPDQTDSVHINKLIADFQKKRLYQRMLEAGLEVNDDKVFAGKLTIRKNIKVTVSEKSEDKLKKERRTKREKTTSWIGPDIKVGTQYFSTASASRLMPFDEYSKDFIPERDVSLSFSSENQYTNRPAFNGYSFALGIKKRLTGFTVFSIQIQFQDGFIENIKVRGKIPESNLLLKFENSYPIPFSTRRDFRKLYETSLYEKTIFERASKNDLGISSLTLRLGDLLDFDQNLEIDSKDYSPVNQVIDEKMEKEEAVINLEKERTSKILELKIFTDLKGIDADNPNGLVQLELSKKLNFWNIRIPAFTNLFNIGVFNFFTPSFTMSKIENNNKRLPIQYIGSQEPDATRPNNYASTLQLLQYQAFRVGADVSFITLDIPGIKSIMTVKSGLYFGRTLIADTLREKTDSMTFKAIADNNIRESGVNSFQFIPEVCFQIFPDKRYGFVLSYKANRYKLLSNETRQVNDSTAFRNYITSLNGDRSGISSYKPQKWIGTAEVFAFFRPSTYTQLFFRYRFNYDMHAVKTNFHQLQLGFTTYLTHTSKGKKATVGENGN